MISSVKNLLQILLELNLINGLIEAKARLFDVIAVKNINMKKCMLFSIWQLYGTKWPSSQASIYNASSAVLPNFFCSLERFTLKNNTRAGMLSHKFKLQV